MGLQQIRLSREAVAIFSDSIFLPTGFLQRKGKRTAQLFHSIAKNVHGSEVSWLSIA